MGVASLAGTKASVSAPVARHANELPETTFTARLFSRMSAEIVQLKPTPHPDWVIDPDDFPSDCEQARTLGVLMAWHGPGVIIKPLAFSSSACDLTSGLASWRVAALTGLPEALVEAFNEGFNEGRLRRREPARWALQSRIRGNL
jgi:hypothetical protein